MKLNTIILTGVAAAIVSFTASVQAIPITGGISYAGGYISNNSDLSVATSISFGPAFVTGANGTFAGFLPGSPVTLATPLAINPVSAPVMSLWSIGIYSFNALTLMESDVSSLAVTINGTGIITDGNAADNVNATWIATFNTTSQTYSFSASAGAVPDGGMTVMLLGVALTGLCLFRNKVTA